MPTQTKTPRGKSRPWVAVFTSLLNDTDLILAGQNARGLFPYLLLHSADQGLNGNVPADPRAVQLFAHLDGGVQAVQEALDSLVAIGKLQREGDLLYIRTWARYQADFGGSSTRSASMIRARHLKGDHKEPREGCDLCAEEAAGAHRARGPRAEAKTVSADAKDAPEPPAAPERTMDAALADFCAAIPEALAEYSSPFEGYTALLDAADEFAAVIADLSKNPDGELRKAVLAHAVRDLVNDNLSQAGVNRADAAAKALGDDGHRYWVHAAVLAAGKDFANEDHILNWLTKAARTERTKAVSA